MLDCYYITIVVDKVGNNVIAFPKIIESKLVFENEDRCTVQTSKTNAHLRTVKKAWVFYSEASAKAFIHENDELKKACDDAKNWLKDYLTKNHRI